MPTFTVQNLIDRAASIADMHDEFIKTKEWLAWYNTERKALEYTLAKRGATARNILFTTVPATDEFILTGPLMAVVGVWEQRSDGHLRPLRIVNFVDNFRQGSPETGPASEVSIELQSDALTESTSFRFFPRPTSGLYIIGSVTIPATATAASSTCTLPMGLEERIVLGMAKMALIKEESDTQEVRQLIEIADQRVEEYAYSIVLAQNPSVRNVDSLQRGWLKDARSVSPDAWMWL